LTLTTVIRSVVRAPVTSLGVILCATHRVAHAPHEMLTTPLSRQAVSLDNVGTEDMVHLPVRPAYGTSGKPVQVRVK
jgi:hypothetical protein